MEHLIRGNVDVIVSPRRSARPYITDRNRCPFCDIRDDENVILEFYDHNFRHITVLENKYPIVSPLSSVYGQHLLVIETEKHTERMWGFDVERLERILSSWALLERYLYQDKKIEYVAIFKNSGKLVASILHEHSHVMGLPFIPRKIFQKKNSEGISVCKTTYWEVFVPSAPRFEWEVHVVSRRPTNHLYDMMLDERRDISRLIKAILGVVREEVESFSMFFFTSPRREKIPIRLEIYPRKGAKGALETGVNVYVLSVDPENVVGSYRKELKELDGCR